ncbi:MAG: DUF4147 domain-containing protein [Planctomycetales bacterium]
MATPPLKQQARDIWQAGVNAVLPLQLLQPVVRKKDRTLTIAGQSFNLDRIGKILVVGGGKAGGGMAAAFENLLGPKLVQEKVHGWVNVPADCVQPLENIHLHAARPAGVNEPTPEGVTGTEQILKLVSEAQPQDVCIVLLSGGGSALLPAPVPEVPLADKQKLTRFLMHAGADIRQLNRVRTQMSRIKGGGLARTCHAGNLIALIISDVIGDPLDIIASGPTVPDSGTPQQALDILRQFGAQPPAVPESMFVYLQQKLMEQHVSTAPSCTVLNRIVGNNATALEAATQRARLLGYRVISLGSENTGTADHAGRDLAHRCREIQANLQPNDPPVCLLSGGEPTVTLTPTSQPRKGGRNQQLVLSALTEFWQTGLEGIALLSGGTDGEDGPTDAAGAILDQELWRTAVASQTDPRPSLAIQNAYHYFEPLNGLLKCGPTHTNVMDLRVALIHPQRA